MILKKIDKSALVSLTWDEVILLRNTLSSFSAEHRSEGVNPDVESLEYFFAHICKEMFKS